MELTKLLNMDNLRVDEVKFEEKKIRFKYDRDSAKQTTENNVKMAQEEAKVLMESLDDNVMRYKAMEGTKSAFKSRRFTCTTTKNQDINNDMVS